MEKQELIKLLDDFKEDRISLEEVVLKLKKEPFEDLGFAKIDHHRAIRQGVPEVIYGEGKKAKEIIKIAGALKKENDLVLITRLSEKKAKKVKKALDLKYFKRSRVGIIGDFPKADSKGYVLIVSAGTSDLGVAEEAELTLKAYGNRVKTLYDAGVSGIHRLLTGQDLISGATAVIAVAGMEGALASVVGGLADCPVIAVPTDVGYGANFNGVSALLSMLNSCASGVSVVNINNGFGAGFIASMINKGKQNE